MSKEKRGFALLDPAKLRSIASKGGKMAHEKGVAYRWTSELAKIAGRKGGLAGARVKVDRNAAA